jgi:hypothetical protein
MATTLNASLGRIWHTPNTDMICAYVAKKMAYYT